MDEKIRKYLDKQSTNHRKIIDAIRDLILKNFPEIKETGMSEGLWYEGKFYLATFKDHINLGIGVDGLTDKEKQNFQGSGKTMRHLKFYSINDINKTNLLALLKLVYTKTHCEHDVKWK